MLRGFVQGFERVRAGFFGGGGREGMGKV